MPLAVDLAELVGHELPAAPPYLVTRGKIQEFADAIGDPNPAYRDPAAARALGHSEVVAPPTFPIVVTLEAALTALTAPAIGVELRRVVHGDQSFRYHRPVRAGDELVATVTIDKVRRMGGSDILTTRTEVTSAGEPVLTTTSTLVIGGEEA